MRINIRHSVYFKVFIPITLIFMMLLGYSYLIWLPSIEKQTEKQTYLHNKHLLSIISQGLITPLLSENIADIYDYIDAIKEEEKDCWEELLIYNKNNKLIYPLKETTSNKNIEGSHILKHDIFFQNKIGELILTYKSSPETQLIYEKEFRFISMVLTGLILTLLLVSSVLYHFVMHPVHKLSEASKQLAWGNFHYSLPKQTNDEIGTLVNAFDFMRKETYNSQDILQTKNSQLEEAKKAAEYASQIKTDFLANMSHELRTPLNSILGMSRLLKETFLNDEQKELVSVINYSSANLQDIVNDILDLSKIEAGEVELEHLGFNLNTILKNNCQAMEVLAQEKNLIFIDSYSKVKLPYVLGDSLRLSRIIYNLIGNAIKYTPAGFIKVISSYKETDSYHIEWICEIIDSGIGISEDKIDNIFEKFTQADISTTRKFGGTGLGLTITKQLVEMMNGRIEVKSKLGEGSTFKIIIPFETTKTLCEEKLEEKDYCGLGTIAPEDCKILIAEDHPVNQVMIEKILLNLGIKNFEIAENGIKTLEKLHKNKDKYDLVFMDCHMPEKNGYDTTKEIREKEKSTGKHIPIIAMTASAMIGDRDKCLNYGMDDYISKPINIEDLKKVLGQWIKF